MDFQEYKVKDFVMEDSFHQWVLEGKSDFWEQWLLDHPEKSGEVEEARQLVQSLRFRKAELTGAQYNRLYQQIMQQVEAHEKRHVTQRRASLPLYTRKLYWLAASVMLLLTVGAAVYGWGWIAGGNRRVYTTNYGEKRTIVLPDQSRVVLNANSSLRVQGNWQQQSEREVCLKGEAFFTVRPQQLAGQAVKFTVHTDDVSIEVLGTEFTVSKRKANTRVVLNEGKIQLALSGEPATKSIVMQPGDWVEYQSNQRKLIRKTVNADTYSSWTANKWILEKTSLQQVADRIEETFGIEVTVSDTQLARESMSGVIPVLHLDETLEVLAATYNVQIQQQNNLIIITKNKSRN